MIFINCIFLHTLTNAIISFIISSPTLTTGSLALCMSALGHKAPEGQLKVNYAIKLKLMSVPQEILASKDPEELFEAATTFNLSHSFLQKSGKSKGAVLNKGW